MFVLSDCSIQLTIVNWEVLFSEYLFKSTTIWLVSFHSHSPFTKAFLVLDSLFFPIRIVSFVRSPDPFGVVVRYEYRMRRGIWLIKMFPNFLLFFFLRTFVFFQFPCYYFCVWNWTYAVSSYLCNCHFIMFILDFLICPRPGGFQGWFMVTQTSMITSHEM